MNLKSKLGRRKVFAMKTIIGFDNSEPANKAKEKPSRQQRNSDAEYFSEINGWSFIP
jgi:hypothetical protein